MTGLNRAGRKSGGNRWRGKLAAPVHADPLVHKFFRLLNSQHTQLAEVVKRSGVGYGTIAQWSTKFNPSITNFRAALNVIGYDLAIVRKR